MNTCEELPQVGPVFEFENSCLGKKRYNTRRKAEGFAKKIGSIYNGPAQHCYHCPFCHGWHLTKIDQNDARWLVKQKKEEVRKTRKIKKAKWRFCVQNIDVPSDDEEDGQALLIPYGETHEI